LESWKNKVPVVTTEKGALGNLLRSFDCEFESSDEKFYKKNAKRNYDL